MMPILASRLRQVKETLMFHVKHSLGSRIPPHMRLPKPGLPLFLGQFRSEVG